MKINGEIDVEKLQDDSEKDQMRVVKRRMALCVMSDQEQQQYAYAPNEGRNNRNPGYPCPDYGEGMD